MSEPTPMAEWPTDPLGALMLLLVVILLALHLGRSASERLAVAVGSIRLRPPTLVPLAEAESTMAVGLLGGAIEDYLGQPDDGATP